MSYQYTFKPAKRKDGKSVGIFKGVEIKEGESPVKDRNNDNQPLKDENGQIVMRPYRFVNLLFEFKAEIRGNASQIAKLSTNGREDYLQALTQMGWTNNLPMREVTDEFGNVEFEPILPDAEEDELGQEIAREDYTIVLQRSIDEFTQANIGKYFVGVVEKDSKNFWVVVPGSLALFVPKG
jgi:hypothetical protein